MSNIAHKNVYQIAQELNPPSDPNLDPSRKESNSYAIAQAAASRHRRELAASEALRVERWANLKSS